MSATFKSEGFPGQRSVVLPRAVLARARGQMALAGLLPTDIGYFPKAAGHYRQRAEGVDQAIFIHCVKGGGWAELAGVRHPVRPGDLLAVPPGLAHAYGAAEHQPWTILWFHAAGHLVPGLLAELGVTAAQPVVYLGEDPQLLTLFEEALGVLEQGYAPGQLHYAARTLLHLVGAMIWHRQRNWRNEPDPGQKVAQSILHMKRHLDQSLRMAALAAMANLSVSHYSTLFREQTGYSPIDYLIRLRMHRACQMLDTTGLSVKEIATRLGYEDPLYFSRLFRTVNDVPPSEYRRLHKG